MKKIFFITAIMFFLCAGCVTSRKILGSGNVESRFFEMKNFSAVNLNGFMHARVEYGPEFTVRIELDDNLLDLLDVYIFDDTLHIEFKKMSFSIAGYKKYNVVITMPALKSASFRGARTAEITGFSDKNGSLFIESFGSGDVAADIIMRAVTAGISGSGKIKLRGETEHLTYRGSGSGRLQAHDLKAQQVEVVCIGSGSAEIYTEKLLEATLNGSGSVSAEGCAETAHCIITGSGKLKAFNLKAENVFIRCSGSGGAEIYAEKFLNTELSGSGSIYYRGNPPIIKTKWSGSGRIIAVDD